AERTAEPAALAGHAALLIATEESAREIRSERLGDHAVDHLHEAVADALEVAVHGVDERISEAALDVFRGVLREVVHLVERIFRGLRRLIEAVLRGEHGAA